MNAKVKPETPEQRAALDRAPIEVELQARQPQSVSVTPRYTRAWVLGINFEAPDLSGLYVQGIQMELFEQLPISPVPASLFNELRSLILPIAHARLGLQLKLLSLVNQRIIVRVHFSECRHGEPRA